MPKHEKSVALQLYPVDFDYITELADDLGVTKRHIMRSALRAGLRMLLEKHPNTALLDQYDAALKQGFEKECRARADQFRKTWALDFGEANHVSA
jgi:hypothetical protein